MKKDFIYNVCFLVDDDRIVNRMHEQIISRTQIAQEVIVCNNPMVAFEMISSQLTKGNYRILILLDINMPEMSGFEFLDQLSPVSRKNSSILDILMVTSSIDEKDIEQGAQNKLVNRYLIKPLKTSDILEFLKYQNLISA